MLTTTLKSKNSKSIMLYFSVHFNLNDIFHKQFALEYPDEHITAVEGSYNKVAMYATEVITSLVFKTSKGKTSPTFGPNLFGVVNGTKFVFEDEGKKIVGFHGRSDNAIDALGVYTVQESLTTSSPLYKLEAKGGTEGRVWDDGAYDGVKTLRIGQDDSRITYLEFDYEKSGKSETRPHGVKGEKLSEVYTVFYTVGSILVSPIKEKVIAHVQLKYVK